jgi:transglutaminase-like putative cysteine protease
MRMRIKHEIVYRYSEPAKAANQKLLVTPRNCNSQRVANWRIEVDQDCRLRQSEDAFGNIMHCFSIIGPFDTMTTLVEGEVETFDAAGVVAGTIERFPPQLYLRETSLTAFDERMRDFALAAAARESGTLAKLHALMAATHERMQLDHDGEREASAARLAFDKRLGVPQDFAHIYIACARALEIPARFISGYVASGEGHAMEVAPHAWTEAFVEGLGWVGFDSTRAMCPDDAYVRVAVGLDGLGAAPVRGARTGGGEESIDMRLRVAMARAQSQN